jgi:hypothetical protein
MIRMRRGPGVSESEFYYELRVEKLGWDGMGSTERRPNVQIDQNERVSLNNAPNLLLLNPGQLSA